MRESTGRAGLTGACPVKYFAEISVANLTGACPVKYFAEMKRSEFNWGRILSGENNAKKQPRFCFFIWQ